MNDTTEKSNLIINGAGKGPGGAYNTIKLNGSGKMEGDFTCDEFVINGSGKTLGSAVCEKLTVNGSGHFLGAVTAGNLRVRGTAAFDMDIKSDEASINGTAKMHGSLDAKTIDISGIVKIEENCSADTFESSGQFKIGGLLSADTINISLGAAVSTAKEIGGEKISVTVSNNGLTAIRSIFTQESALLKADSIEGNDIELESTKAKIVRGHNVTLGKGCDIDIVEYTGTLNKENDAKVGEEKKL